MEEGTAGESEGNGPMKPSKPSKKKAKPPKAPLPTERETTRAVLDRLRAHGIYSRKVCQGGVQKRAWRTSWAVCRGAESWRSKSRRPKGGSRDYGLEGA